MIPPKSQRLSDFERRAIEFGAAKIINDKFTVLMQSNPKWNDSWDTSSKTFGYPPQNESFDIKSGSNTLTVSKFLPLKMYQFQKIWEEEQSREMRILAAQRGQDKLIDSQI